MEASNAKDTLQSEPAAAGAYDRVPFASASAIFTMDTSNDIFLLHSIQVWSQSSTQVACVSPLHSVLPEPLSN